MDSQVSFLTPILLEKIVAEYQWPIDYTIEDDDPDGVIMEFPNCGLIFSDDCDGGVDVRFFPEHTNTSYNLHIFHAMQVFVPENKRSNGKIPGLKAIPISSPFPSLDNTTNGIRNACTILTQYLTPVIQGDFTWVDEYRRMFPETGC